MFLTRGDSIGICQTVQLDALKLTIEKLECANQHNAISIVKTLLKELTERDISGLGM